MYPDAFMQLLRQKQNVDYSKINQSVLAESLRYFLWRGKELYAFKYLTGNKHERNNFSLGTSVVLSRMLKSLIGAEAQGDYIIEKPLEKRIAQIISTDYFNNSLGFYLTNEEVT